MKKVAIWLLALVMVLAVTSAMAVTVEEPAEPECTHANWTEENYDCTPSRIGGYMRTCDDCGELLDSFNYHRGGYKYVPAVAQTCKTEGNEEGAICTICNEVDWGCDSIDKLEHDEADYIPQPDIASTCFEPGYTVTKCPCGFIFKVARPDDPAGHNWVPTDKYDPAPNCTESGYQVWVCTKHTEGCEGEELRYVKANGHFEGAGAIVEQDEVAPTCTEEGYIYKKCWCGYEETKKLDPNGHAYDKDGKDWIQVEAETCTKPGKQERVCSVCGEGKQTQFLPEAIGHTWEDEKKWEAGVTCASDSKLGKQYSDCVNGCGAILVYKENAKPNHVEDDPIVTQAWCEMAGFTTIKCKNCQEILSEKETEAALAHVWKKQPYSYEATCTSKGMDFYVCERCNDRYEDELEMLPHTYEWTPIEPSCLIDGGKLGVCTECGHEEQVVEEGTALDHDWSEWKVWTVACKDRKGVEYRECDRCGEQEWNYDIPALDAHDFVTVTRVYNDHPYYYSICNICHVEEQDWACEEVRIPLDDATDCGETAKVAVYECKYENCPAGKHNTFVIEEYTIPHTPEKVPAVDATCTATGLTEGEKCSVCGIVTVEQKVTDKIAHTEEAIPAVAATCTATGLTEGTKCSVCGIVIKAQEETAKVAHTAEKIAPVAATCTATGLTEGEKCSVCGEILKAQEEVAALGHKYTSKVTKPATATADGVRTYTCGNCGDSFTEKIPATGVTEAPETSVPETSTPAAPATTAEVEKNVLTITAEGDENTLVITAELFAEWTNAKYDEILFVVGDVTVCIPMTAIFVDAETTMEISVIEGVLSVASVKAEVATDITAIAAVLGIAIK